MPYPDNLFYSDHAEKRRQRLGLRTSPIQDARQDGTIIVTVYDPRTEPDTWTDNYSQRQ